MAGTKILRPRRAHARHERRQVNVQLDSDAYALLREMASTKSRGAFIAGLIRAEYARQQERWQRREQGLPGIEAGTKPH